MKASKKITGILLFLLLIFSCSKQDDKLLDNALINGITSLNDLKSAVVIGSEISQIIEGRYIVVFKNHVTNPKAEAAKLKSQFGLETGHIYEYAIKGFSAYIPGNAINGLRNNPNIDYIEPDITMKAFAQTIPTGVKRISADQNPVADINGDGGNVDVDVAILDSGVDEDHPELNVAGGVRFYTIYSGPPKNRGSFEDNNFNDDNGHGTHVAGTVGAYDNDAGVVGVAPGARIWAVKILNAQGSGTLTDIIKGLDWVTARASTIEVVNMSIGGQGLSTAYQSAIQRCVSAGVVVVVAAGNESMDVYGPDGTFGTNDDIIPAAYPEVAAISALADSDGEPGGLGADTSYDPDDSFASAFSNFSQNVVSYNPVTSPGKAIDLMLPGVDILSTYLDAAYAIASGTSMSSPHATGLAALYVAKYGRANDASGVYAIRQALIDNGMPQQSQFGLANLNDPDGNEENLGWAGPSDENRPPVADAGDDQTLTDTDLSGGELVTLDGSGSTDDVGITSYTWKENGLTIATGVNPNVNIGVGSHTITLEVSDGEYTDTDDVIIKINPGAVNQPPVADAGDDQTLTDTDLSGGELVSLDGSGSTDDVGITSYIWKENGSTIGTGVNPTVNLSVGSHTITLEVTDGEFSDTDEVIITVNEAPVVNLTVTSINPSSVNLGTSNITVKGTGFLSGASLLFENGAGAVPIVSNLSVVDSETITATIYIKTTGPFKTRYWDVRVTNLDSSTAVLLQGLTVVL